MTTHAPFKAIPVNAQEQFRLHLLGMLTEIFDNVRAQGKLDEFLEHFGFLQSYAERIDALWGKDTFPSAAVWQRAVRKWAGKQASPLSRLDGIMPGPVARIATIMAVAIEEDPRLSLLIDPEGGAPTLGGVTAFLTNHFPAKDTGELRLVIADLVAIGVLQFGKQDAPRVDWTLRATPAAFELISGAPCRRDHFHFDAPDSLPKAKYWIAPTEGAETPADIAELLAEARTTTVLLRGDQNNGRKTMLQMAAGKVGLGILQCNDLALAEREHWQEANLVAALSDAILLIECSPGPGERVEIPSASVLAPHLAIITSPSASVEFDRPNSLHIPINLPRPDAASRAAHWRRAGWNGQAEKLAERVLTAGHIHRIAKGAERATQKASREAIDASLASLRDPRLESTAHPLPFDASLDELVLDGAEQDEIDTLALRCRLRESLAGNSESGVKALLSGPSGTGKTLAAKHLARMLGRPLYRIDMASTVNKYIGETEKNLERTFAAAEELDIVLLLDEGDALLAKRTDVGSATDRYANLETNFLLQRLEDFRGIILITTNDGERIDRAFRRRMDAIIPFRMPDQLRRQEILLRQLGEHKVGARLIDEIACRCDFSGGQIHNVAMHARLLSLAEEKPINNAHVMKAVEREYRKTGEHCPLRPALAEVG